MSGSCFLMVSIFRTSAVRLNSNKVKELWLDHELKKLHIIGITSQEAEEIEIDQIITKDELPKEARALQLLK